MRIARIARTRRFNSPTASKSSTWFHLVSAISNGLILEFYRDSVDPMWGKMYHQTLQVNSDGTVSPPEVPGHGAAPNCAELEQYRLVQDRVAVGV
jgi:hypothetical protein